MPEQWGLNRRGDCELGTDVPSRGRSEGGPKSPTGSCPVVWNSANEVWACSSALNPRYGGPELW